MLFSSCKYTDSVARQLSWLHDTLDIKLHAQQLFSIHLAVNKHQCIASLQMGVLCTSQL